MLRVPPATYPMTTDVAALTFQPGKRIDRRVSDLTCRTVRATPQLTVENHAAADTRSQRDTNHVARAARRAQPHLADSRGVCVVLEQHGPAESIFEHCF